MSGELEQPMFSITLQRSTVDIGGEGVLTVGKLPAGIDNSSLTWVPVRLYEVNDGGLRPPTFAPNEKYPLRWEVELDGVFLDGERVQDSTIPAVGVNPGKITALIDTGNSILRGPDDMVDAIFGKISPDYNPGNVDDDPLVPCSVPHTIAFQIGGKMFPVDPRDFIGPRAEGDTTTCVADTLVGTDAPRLGSLYRWSLGDPFMKSNLVAFHYGNMTHPSVDPPRIGFLSTVPSNAGALLKQAVEHAKNNGGKFKQTLVPAPTGVAATAAEVTVSIRTTHAEPSGTPARPGMITQTVSADASPATPTSEGRLNKNNAAITITLSLSQHVVFWLGAHFALLFWL
ncbi:hypothetical protein DXG03_002585 [Asterophora parasitica]|uniref:Peptidase A1 domain-containing protein n=1 Tax=Asterophora parasitica TaxID=117018 RepID=A0A9P7G8B7_9AGAR|nr:hypothetical protein DXG03_002585 [Asterophora parasitica]